MTPFLLPFMTLALFQGDAVTQSPTPATPVLQGREETRQDPEQILQEVSAAIQKKTAELPRPKNGDSKGIAAYRKAVTEAQNAAAAEALKKHEELFRRPEAMFVKGRLLLFCEKWTEAVKSFVEFAGVSKDPEKKTKALLLAAQVENSMGAGAKAASKILAGIDPDNLPAKFKRYYDSFERRLEADLKREKLNGRPVPTIAASHVLKGPAPDEFSLDAYKGKVLILDFWATWCPPCRGVIPDLVEMQAKYGDRGLQILGITKFYGSGMDFSDPASTIPHGGKTVRGLDEEAELKVNEAFMKKFELNYPIVFAKGNVAGEAFFVQGIPTLFVVDREGKVLGSVVGGGEANHKKVVAMVEKALGLKTKDGESGD